MPAGTYNNTGLSVSEFACDNQQAKVATSIPLNYSNAQGQMDFLKRTSGDTIYIGLCGKKVSAKQYDYILTDANPFVDVQGLALGDIQVLGTGNPAVAPSLISITILACT